MEVLAALIYKHIRIILPLCDGLAVFCINHFLSPKRVTKSQCIQNKQKNERLSQFDLSSCRLILKYSTKCRKMFELHVRVRILLAEREELFQLGHQHVVMV